MSSSREQRDRDRYRERDRDRERERNRYRERDSDREREREQDRDRERDRDRRRRGVTRPEATHDQSQPQRRTTGTRGETSHHRSRSTRERERDRDRDADVDRERERDRERDRDPPRRQSAREPARTESGSNLPPPRPPAAIGGSSRRESTRDPGRRHSRRDREGDESRRETVRLVPRDLEVEREETEAGLGYSRRQSHRRSQSTRERDSGRDRDVERARSSRNPQRERSRRERMTVPGAWVDADSYDQRQEEMRAKYQPIPPPPPVIAPVAAGWDGSGDLEKGSGSADIADKTALLDKRASTSSGIGNTKRKRRCHPCFWLLLLVGIILLIILIPVGVLVVGKDKSGNKNSGSADNESEDRRDGLKNIDRASIPPEARGTYYDPFDWYDTKDFNCTYTDEKVGDLPIMGLFSEWDDSVRANDNVPPLNEPFDYGKQPIRGVNVGGWFVMEPFITPSYFKEWDSRFGVVDEYTLSKQLGPETARKTFEKHYSEFIKEEDFRMIRDAGLDHVRIPFGYWAVMQLDGDPYVYQVEWRYLLRAIEYCRKYGLRVKLDLHSVPGGANGWNHSGRLGPIHWLNGTDGDRNAQLTLELHDKMSKFFSQPRYKNVVTMYGLVNEPRMTFLDADKVIAWSEQAYKIIRGNGYEGKIVFGDGFRGLEKWKGEFQSLEGMVLDVHQYVIFNTGQISQTHTGKVQFACKGWSAQLLKINNPDTGYGPTMVGEWGQADTDCTPYLNNVGVGSRWEGTLNYGEDEPGNVLTPTCPNKNQCSCEKANEHPNNYSDDYKLFLKTFAIAQMDAFENGWGWMYWTWQTEDSHQWSYRKGLEAGILPKAAVNREWSCQDDIPDFAARGLPEYY